MPYPEITSRQNPRVKQDAGLRDRRARDERGQTLVFGVRENQRALASGVRAARTYFCRDLAPATIESLLSLLVAHGAEVIEVNRDVFERLAYGDRLDGVVSVVEVPRRSLADLPLPACPLVAVVEGIEKPGNLGALLRSADGAGLDAVLVADGVIDLWNPNTIRASVAAVFASHVIATTTAEVQAWLAARGVTCYAARPDAPTMYWDADFRGSSALLLGSEAHGLTEAWSGTNIRPIALPMLGVGDSLNLAVSSAVLFYEARRQRGLP